MYKYRLITIMAALEPVGPSTGANRSQCWVTGLLCEKEWAVIHHTPSDGWYMPHIFTILVVEDASFLCFLNCLRALVMKH